MIYVRFAQKKVPDDKLARKIHKIASKGWAKPLLSAAGARLHPRGIENIPLDKTILFVSNHHSDLDILVFLALSPIPIGFVAKIELLKVPVLRKWMKYLRCVFIDRNDIRQTAKVILEGIEILKSGHSMVVFPEGTRSVTGEPLPFKPGSLKLATKSKACVVPVTINGSCKIMEGNGYRMKPADVYVQFHPPIYTENLTSDETKDLPAKVEGTIIDRIVTLHQREPRE
jgi:1-acyl-sn-glycerol-3-phosphate acyltransferase